MRGLPFCLLLQAQSFWRQKRQYDSAHMKQPGLHDWTDVQAPPWSLGAMLDEVVGKASIRFESPFLEFCFADHHTWSFDEVTDTWNEG